MAISSRSARPDEWASKANHTHIIKDEFIQDFLSRCDFPKSIDDIDSIDKSHIFTLNNLPNPIEHILAVDGGYTITDVKKGFPSSQIAFFQFGAVLFNAKDLDNLSEKPFIFPEDMQKLHNLQRFKLALPIRNIVLNNQTSLTHSIRKVIYDFFMSHHGNEDTPIFMETLKWLIFEEYKPAPRESYDIASNPYTKAESNTITITRNGMSRAYTFDVNGETIYLTDVFRLHEAIDDEYGATGILGYVTRLIEQIILIHFIRFIYKQKSALLEKILFISDGPLSFAGQTANMHKVVREMCNHLQRRQKIFLVGIEKSGAFVEHAREICNQNEKLQILGQNHFMLLSNNYIYKYITPGNSKTMHYGRTSYYSGKVIFHSQDGQILVISIPIKDKDDIKEPSLDKFSNLEVILANIQKLRCVMYDDSIVPIALANKLVSLANHPSKLLLEKFAQAALNQ